MDEKFVRGDLVFWLAPSGKFWAFVLHAPKKELYLVSDSCGHTAPRDRVRHATVAQVIRYQRRRWGKSAAVTRSEIEYTLRTHPKLRG